MLSHNDDRDWTDGSMVRHNANSFVVIRRKDDAPETLSIFIFKNSSFFKDTFVAPGSLSLSDPEIKMRSAS